MAKLSADDIKALRKTVFFGSLPKTSLDALIRQSHVYDIEPNQDLFRQGDPATAVFAVLSGLIKLTAGQPDGREVLVQMFQTGDSFAEALAFGNESYPVTATGLVKSRVLAAPAAIVQRLGTAEPETFKAIVAATYRHLHALVRQIEELKGNSGLDRLARYIRAQVDTERGETELEIPFDKKGDGISIRLRIYKVIHVATLV